MIRLIQGDITKLKVDAIVNAANSSLSDGAGVNGAIQSAAGTTVLAECAEWIRKHGQCPTGSAMITNAGNLPCTYIIHAVGPVWRNGYANEDVLLNDAYQRALNIAFEHGIRSIAFPNISTGIYGFPKERAARIALDAVNDFMKSRDLPEEVIFCCFDEASYQIYTKLL